MSGGRKKKERKQSINYELSSLKHMSPSERLSVSHVIALMSSVIAMKLSFVNVCISSKVKQHIFQFALLL